MSLVLYDTKSRQKRPFVPIHPDRVGLYVCGPTVYGQIHVGNARPLIVFDVLTRLLRHQFQEVVYVRNITDVDDKIMAEAKATGVPIDALTRTTTERFHHDTEALGCLPPDFEPRATEHVAQMIALIGRLIDNGHAYAASGNVLFHVPSFPEYGQLSGRNRDEQVAGARVDVAPYKRDPADFTLWKPSTPDQPGWDSPWGRGRPGWHIECSAMSAIHPGVPFDIHGGGIDLVFPHHENEIAQTRCADGLAHMANYWLHNGFVTVNGEKMAKSLGNFTTVEDVLAKVPGEAIRLWTLSTHYRSPLDFSWEGIEQAKKTLDRFYGALARTRAVDPPPARRMTEERQPRLPLTSSPGSTGGPTATSTNEPDQTFLDALADDLNTPKAIAALHDLLRQLNRTNAPEIRNRLIASAKILGLLQQDPKEWIPETYEYDPVKLADQVLDDFIERHFSGQGANEEKAVRRRFTLAVERARNLIWRYKEVGDWADLKPSVDNPKDPGRTAEYVDKMVRQVLNEKDLSEAKIAAENFLSMGIEMNFINPSELQIPSENAKINAMVRVIEMARELKDYTESDNIRDELRKMGVQVKDSKSGSTWERVWGGKLERR